MGERMRYRRVKRRVTVMLKMETRKMMMKVMNDQDDG